MALIALVLPGALLACSCVQLSDRVAFAQAEAIVLLRIERTSPTESPRLVAGADPGAFSETVEAVVRRSWMAPDLVGRTFAFTHTGTTSIDCGERPLATGSLWLTSLGSREAPDFAFGDCAWSKLWDNSPDRIRRLDMLAREFERRLHMSEQDWEAALRPLLQRAQAFAGSGAVGCVARLRPGAHMREYQEALACIRSNAGRARAFWALLEDPFSADGRFYALAQAPQGDRVAWQAGSQLDDRGTPLVDVATLEERSCGQLDDGLRRGLGGLCFGEPGPRP